MDVELSKREIAALLYFGLQGLQAVAKHSEIEPEHLEPFVSLSLELMATARELDQEPAPESIPPLTPERERAAKGRRLELVPRSDPSPA